MRPPPADFSEVNPNAAYTTADVAALFRTSVDTVKRWIRTGKLDAVRVGQGPYRVLGSAIFLCAALDPKKVVRPTISEKQWKKRATDAYREAMAS